MKHKASTKKALKQAQEKTEKLPEKPPVKCPVCGKELKDKSGFAGHMRIIHNTKVGIKEEIKQLKSKLELTLKELADHKDCILKSDVVKCPKCNSAIWARDLVMITPSKTSIK